MGIFTKTVQYLREHLGKTRQKISSGLTSILTLGRDIDDDLLEQLEETLISDDIGVETTSQLIGLLAGSGSSTEQSRFGANGHFGRWHQWFRQDHQYRQAGIHIERCRQKCDRCGL
ncbi:MAG: signal recognition particle receptor subunit alpha [Planctomycetota bacterium]|jgi:hypothetical protein